MTIESVWWHDAWLDNETPADGYKDDYLVNTVGFVVRDTPGILSIAAEKLPGEDGYKAITHIPQAVIKVRAVLEHASTPRKP